MSVVRCEGCDRNVDTDFEESLHLGGKDYCEGCVHVCDTSPEYDDFKLAEAQANKEHHHRELRQRRQDSKGGY